MYSKIALFAAVVAALGQPAFAQSYHVGQRVTIQDPNNKWGGGTISGTIDGDLGENYKYASRWHVKLDTGATTYFDDWAMKHGGAPRTPAPAAVANAPRPIPAAPAAPPRTAAQPNAAAPPGAVHGAHDWGKVPPRGSFKYGKPNPNPIIARDAPTPPGLQPTFVRSSAGNESPVGRWYTRTGGVWTKTGNPDRDGNQMYEWGSPEPAELINIMPDGTWSMSNFGKYSQGRWYDIGQNVVRLVNLDGGDWTASVYDHMIQFRSELGQTKDGNRY